MSIALAVMAAFVSWLGAGANTARGQSSPARTFDEFVVTVGPEEGNDGTWFRVDFKDGRAREFLVPDVFKPPHLADGLSQYQGRRLIIRSERAQVVIVDPAAATVTDRFLALREEPSPDGRYLAIERWHPNGVPYVDSIYSIYDLQQPPDRNGPRKPRDSDAGWIVYPPRNAAEPTFNSFASGAADSHTLLSPLTWINPELLTFVDHHNGVATLLLVDLAAGVGGVRITETPLNLPELLRPNAPENAPRLIRVSHILPVELSQAFATFRLVFEQSWVLQKREVEVRAQRAR